MTRFTTDLPADHDGPVMIIRIRTIHVDKEATADTVDAGMRKMRMLMPTPIRKPSDDFDYRLIVADDWQYYYDMAKANLKAWPYDYNEVDGEYVYTNHAPADWRDLAHMPARHLLTSAR